MHTRHLTGPGELIAAIPTMLGFIPSEAVVAVALDGTGEVLAVARVDRLDATAPDSAAAVSSAIAAKLRSVAARRVFLVTFTNEDVAFCCPAIDALRPVIETAVERVDVWACDGERYYSPGCADPNCCPEGGRAVPWLTGSSTSPVRANATAHTLGNDDVAASRERKRSAARAADRWWSQREVDTEHWRGESWMRCEESFPLDASAPAIGRAIAGVQDIRVRDALIVEWLGGSGEAVVDTLLGHESRAVTAVLDGAMRDPFCPPPDPAAVIASLRWCRRLLAHARRKQQAPLLALMAVVLWWSGDLPAAQRKAVEALHRDPLYSLAQLVDDVAAAGIEPAWRGAVGGS